MGTPRYACLKCDKLLPIDAEECPFCGAKAKHSVKANIRGAALAAKEVWDEGMGEVLRDEPVSAVLLATESHRGVVGTATRGAVGYGLFGVFGAAVGITTAKKKTMATFSVKYASGRVATETVKIGSARFRELAALVHK